MLCSVARGALYAGRATLQGPVIYLTGEGVSGFKRRLVAMRQHLDIEGQGVPFFMIGNVPDLGSEATDLPQLLAELDAFIQIYAPDGVRAIVLDTLARCMGAADENSARDMGRFIDRCGAIERHFECLVAVVHHVGKNPERGGRGSNAQNGAADVTLVVEKTETHSKVRIEEFKDGREGQEWTFRLAPYDLSATFHDSCATPSQHVENSTCVVEILSEPGKAQLSATKKSKPPSGWPVIC
jgi:RecA-family ATPase